MSRIVKNPQGEIVKAVRIYYEESHGYYLRGDEFAPGVVILSIATIYGPLYATIAQADEGMGDRWVIRFDTEAPSQEMAKQAEVDGGQSADLPPQVLWDLNVDLLVSLRKQFRSRKTSDDHYPSRPDGGPVGADVFGRTAVFGHKLAKQVAVELHELDVIKEAAVLGLLRARHDVLTMPRNPHPSDQAFWKKQEAGMEKWLLALMNQNFRAGILGHSSKEIRIQGMSWLAEQEKTKAKKSRASGVKR